MECKSSLRQEKYSSSLAVKSVETSWLWTLQFTTWIPLAHIFRLCKRCSNRALSPNHTSNQTLPQSVVPVVLKIFIKGSRHTRHHILPQMFIWGSSLPPFVVVLRCSSRSLSITGHPQPSVNYGAIYDSSSHTQTS